MFFCLHHIPYFGRANVKDVHLNVWGGGCILSHSAFFMCKEKNKKREREKELKKTKMYHGVYFEGRTFTSVPNRMRMCMGMHAPSYPDALC